MSLREFPLHYGALKVCCQKKKTPGPIRVSGNRLVILEDAQGVISGGYVNKEAITKELPWVSFQDTCDLNTGIALLKASEGRLSLISIIHPLLCLPSTLVSHSRHFFSNITHITCEKKDHWLRPQPGRGRGSQLDFSNADLLSVSP